MKKILVFGTYDKFHPGHQYFLTEAKTHGDYLTVIIARDHNVEKLKGKLPRDNELTRQAKVAAWPAVDEAILGLEDFSKKEAIIDQVQPDVICLGYDQAPNFKAPSHTIQVIRIVAYQPEKYKSSLL